jgi:3-oxoacyl-[acyl-carrier protein] reductase
MKKAIVLAGSRGIGKSIADSLKELGMEVITTSTQDLDTSNIAQIKEFAKEQKKTDILVLNTGGPPAKDFASITEEEWNKYHNQLFVGFCVLLQNMEINRGGYIFLISSSIIKEPIPNLLLSIAYRAAFSSVLKVLSKSYAAKEISCINIAPGPVGTDRLKNLVNDMDEFSSTLPMKRVGKPEEIGKFIKSIVGEDIKYMTGVTINFDGGISNYVF